MEKKSRPSIHARAVLKSQVPFISALSAVSWNWSLNQGSDLWTSSQRCEVSVYFVESTMKWAGIYLFALWPAMAAISSVWSVWAALGREKCYVWLSHRQSFPTPTFLFFYCLSFCSTCPTSAFFLLSFLHVFCCVNLKGIHGRKPTLIPPFSRSHERACGERTTHWDPGPFLCCRHSAQGLNNEEMQKQGTNSLNGLVTSSDLGELCQ